MIQFREYGGAGPRVVLLHGGPGARGHMAPVGRELAARGFSVLEPLQRLSLDAAPLAVARHVVDLAELIAAKADAARPALIGSSWGAMLALAFAAAHPNQVGPVVLVGCGTFDVASREEFRRRLDERLGDRGRLQMSQLGAMPDANLRLRAIGDFLTPFYSHDLLSEDLELEQVDERGNAETWSDMIRLQESGVYPAAFRDIRSPVLMLHGTADPHPGRMIRDSLLPHLQRLEYVELERCGHYPWLERHAREPFFTVLANWLNREQGA